MKFMLIMSFLARWFNGRIADSVSVGTGSNPVRATGKATRGVPAEEIL